MKTHRCEGLLHCDVDNPSIRYYNPYSNVKADWAVEGWWLHTLETDWDYDYTGLLPLFRIKYCPFCGERLEEQVRDCNTCANAIDDFNNEVDTG